MKVRLTAVALIMSAPFAATVFAQTVGSEVQRDINQQHRIEQGVQSGQLTNKEASRLEWGQARVDRAEARAGADGHVGAREQARIQHRENVQSRHILRDKHNNKAH